ncbi:MAG: D-alanyl-D-alanine carboxypeptidase/D-alanyl-D-alanine-endopeptidase, partial [Leptolyngbya sp. SIO1D8]|nr:D-alanyl-D-alanine carboxypeptidase/D-alanyl-D-alanine-endopeptidase [Leptolyngbya sp. SIO1D8]
MQGNRMKKIWVKQWLTSLGAALGTIALPLPAVALCPADLPAAVAEIAARPELTRARLGVQVETLTGDVIYSQEGDRFFVPASTLKLLTTAAVLTQLG